MRLNLACLFQKGLVGLRADLVGPNLGGGVIRIDQPLAQPDAVMGPHPSSRPRRVMPWLRSMETGFISRRKEWRCQSAARRPLSAFERRPRQAGFGKFRTGIAGTSAMTLESPGPIDVRSADFEVPFVRFWLTQPSRTGHLRCRPATNLAIVVQALVSRSRTGTEGPPPRDWRRKSTSLGVPAQALGHPPRLGALVVWHRAKQG